MFIVLFTIAKIWNQLKRPSEDEWITKLWYIYTTEHYSAVKKKKGNLTFCNSMDELKEHYARWNKPAREIQIPYVTTYLWNLMNKINK